MESQNSGSRKQRIITAPLGAKSQITLPKAVREALRLGTRHDVVGFVIRGGRVAITRIEPVPSSDPFTEAEWKAIDELAAEPPVETLPDAKRSLEYLRRHLQKRG